jgi:pyroglutamyl-peptidase
LIESLKTADACVGVSKIIPPGMNVQAVCLPVTFDKAFEILAKEIESYHPDVVLAFGQAGGRAAIEIERVAINCLDADIPDNRGVKPRDQMITEGGAPAYFTTLPMRAMLEKLAQAGLPSRISNSAGTYVCNYVFYKLQEFAKDSQKQTGFIHVPYLPEQAAKNPGTPSMEFSELERACGVILRALRPLSL